MMVVDDGQYVGNIDESTLTDKEREEMAEFEKKIKEGLPMLVTGYKAVVDGIRQVRNLSNKDDREKEKLEKRIRNDVIKALVKSMPILEITDPETGKEENRRTLEKKDTEYLVKLLKENIEELERYTEGKVITNFEELEQEG